MNSSDENSCNIKEVEIDLSKKELTENNIEFKNIENKDNKKNHFLILSHGLQAKYQGLSYLENYIASKIDDVFILNIKCSINL
jgi:hypothetical protein